jgi:YVTN family beta-propeller protein
MIKKIALVIIGLCTILSAQWLETTIYVPDSLFGVLYPRVFTYNANNNTIYVGGEAGDCVIAIDGQTNQKIARIPAGSNIYALCWNSTNNKVYCANYESDDVSVIDGATNQVITRIQVGDEPCAFAWNSIQNRTYVANKGSSTISVIRDVTGIEEYFLPDVKPFTLEIYPNPAKSFFVIRSSLPVKEIEIFDVSGKLIKEINFSTKEPKISLNGIKTGVYLLKIKTENKELTKKLIIK